MCPIASKYTVRAVTVRLGPLNVNTGAAVNTQMLTQSQLSQITTDVSHNCRNLTHFVLIFCRNCTRFTVKFVCFKKIYIYFKTNGLLGSLPISVMLNYDRTVILVSIRQIKVFFVVVVLLLFWEFGCVDRVIVAVRVGLGLGLWLGPGSWLELGWG